MQPGVAVEEAMLNIEHLKSAIENVKKSQREVGGNTEASSRRRNAVQEVQIAKKMLGTKDKSPEESESL